MSGPPFARPHRTLTDGVVTLREWREDDVPAVTRICRDPEIARFTRIPSPYAERDAREFLARHDAEELGFAIAGRGGELLGAIGLRDDGELRGEFGYWVAPEARGQGVASRALRLFAEWALRDAGLARVQLYTHVENPASQRAAERAGFRREGVLRSYMLLRGRRFDAVLFGLVPEDLE